MAADTKLLPLPDKVEVDKHLPTGVRIYAYDANTLKDYARANVAHAIAAKDAEIEALRVEVAAQRTRADAMAGEAIKHEARAEWLAEALLVARGRMLGQVKWVACDCGCELDKPADAVSVAWLRASDLLREQEEGK